ncbi:MAG TPA: lectin-like protein, partial [Coleofasciculaceae cyanobacterium]
MVVQWDSSVAVIFGNNHFYEFVPGSFTWDQAKADAETRSYQGQSGYLATITSAEESAFINNLLGNNNAWIGLSDAAEEGDWEWVTGETSTFTNWATNSTNGIEEPNGDTGENYAAL